MYRAAARPCPNCKAPMETITINTADFPNVEVDLCKTCAALFLDFDDGEPGNVARALEENVTLPESSKATIATEPQCPDCQTTMDWGFYRDSGPPVARCGGCASLYVPLDYVDDLSRASWVYSDSNEVSEFIAVKLPVIKN